MLGSCALIGTVLDRKCPIINLNVSAGYYHLGFGADLFPRSRLRRSPRGPWVFPQQTGGGKPLPGDENPPPSPQSRKIKKILDRVWNVWILTRARIITNVWNLRGFRSFRIQRRAVLVFRIMQSRQFVGTSLATSSVINY